MGVAYFSLKWKGLLIYFSVIFKNFVWYFFLYIKRGETFREILLHLGEIRSLLPDSVHVMALTATITKSVRLELEKFLEMRDAVSVVLNPCKSNIMIFVSEYRSIPKTFAPLLYKLRNERTMCLRTIIYCRSLDDFANFYLYFKSEMGQEFSWKDIQNHHSRRNFCVCIHVLVNVSVAPAV